MTIEIKVENYIYKYLTKIHPEAIKIIASDKIGMLCLAFLKFRKKYPVRKRDLYSKKLSKTIAVEVELNKFIEVNIKSYNVINASIGFNNCIKRLLYDNYYSYIAIEAEKAQLLSKDFTYVDLTSQFLAKYDLLNTEINIETLQRNLRRHFKKHE